MASLGFRLGVPGALQFSVLGFVYGAATARIIIVFSHECTYCIFDPPDPILKFRQNINI